MRTGRRGALLGLAGAALTAAAGRRAHAATAAAVEVAPGVFVLPGVHEAMSPANGNAIANVGFVVGGEAVAVIDPGGSLAHGRRLRQAVAAATPLPVRHLVISHVHPDHCMGAAAFADLRPEVIGHARLPEALAQRREFYLRLLAREIGEAAAAGSAPLAPTRLVEGRAELDLGGGRVLALRAHGPAHTDNDLSLFDRATGTLWLADLLFAEHIPTLDGSLTGWLRELAALRDTQPAARAVPGHGPPAMPWPAAAAPLTTYLEALRDGTRAAIAAGTDIAAAPERVATAEAAQWRLADIHHGRNVTVAYRQLEWE